jgi:hypothetical protein
MFRGLICALVMSVSFGAWAQDAAGFHKRFQLVKSADGKVLAIRLKVFSHFSLRPFVEQVKNDLLSEQRRWNNKSAQEMEARIDAELVAMGLDPYAKDGEENAGAIKDSLMNIPNIKVEESFAELRRTGLLAEFEARLQEALIQFDLSAVAHLEDSRFFYRRAVTHAVVSWGLEQAKRRLGSVPLLNLASFVMVKVHDLLLEQKTFHHNMMLHYFQNVPESALGMTKEEVDRAVSSIFEYRIQATGLQESNRAAREWDRYGWNSFYATLRMGNTRQRGLESDGTLRATERLNYAFATFDEGGVKRVYNLLQNKHMFSGKPALAYDFAQPDKVRRERALMNLAQVGLGFLPVVPGWIKGMVDSFIDSMYVEQRRLEGALVPMFEARGDASLVQAVYRQSINPYLIR